MADFSNKIGLIFAVKLLIVGGDKRVQKCRIVIYYDLLVLIIAMLIVSTECSNIECVCVCCPHVTLISSSLFLLCKNFM